MLYVLHDLKNCTTGKITIDFSYINMEEKEIRFTTSLYRLWVDWWKDCEMCPPNDTKITIHCIVGPERTYTPVENVVFFEDLMEAVGGIFHPRKPKTD